ncbi:PAS domain-containing protein [Arcobacter ellisii]|uniref:PAS sensor domain-containing protein n=1 Tax=Arcobacter ellisii TaxID=913109 RepID=A0A347U752_9BACT|nr:PAS domain-containing protein [Arcobacter ellisii]AXX94680.1 PAS sensor-containing signal transduction protein [Arcobacter ellisii]RXI28802.1 PAS sensor domain-containing protein [Arcobacter ellisii]
MSKEIVLDDSAFLVSETDERGIIIFANDDFCKIAEYGVDELIGKPHNIVRHKDMPKAAFKDLWDCVKQGKVWTGYVKNATKSGNYYWVFATVFPTTTSEGNKGFLSCRRKASQEEINESVELYERLNRKEQ